MNFALRWLYYGLVGVTGLVLLVNAALLIRGSVDLPFASGQLGVGRLFRFGAAFAALGGLVHVFLRILATVASERRVQACLGHGDWRRATAELDSLVNSSDLLIPARYLAGKILRRAPETTRTR